MRMFVVILLACSASFGQFRAEFRRKYGEAVSETFTVRLGIDATVRYASNGGIVELLISPRTQSLVQPRGASLSQDAVRAVLDELIPKSDRGKFVRGAFLDANCLPEDDCGGSLEQYEKVTIRYNAGAKGGIAYAVVRWKE